jgi:hypothetical protein
MARRYGLGGTNSFVPELMGVGSNKGFVMFFISGESELVITFMLNIV